MTDPQFTYFCNYSKARQLADIEKFSRSSTATLVNKTGSLVSSPINAPRFDFDPITLESRGLLLENSSTNLLLQSQASTGWSRVGTNPPGVTNDALFNGESCVAIQYDSTVATGFANRAQRSQGVNLSSGIEYATSMRIALSRPLVNGESVVVYLSGGYSIWPNTLINSNHPASTNPGTFVTIDGGATPSVASSNTLTSYCNQAISSPLVVYVNCAQVEQATGASSYIPTTTSAVTRSASALAVESSGIDRIISRSEGTLYFDGVSGRPSSLHENLIMLSDGTNTSFIGIQRQSNVSDWTFFYRDRSSPQQRTSIISHIPFGSHAKAALSFRKGRFCGALNGIGFETTMDSVPFFDRLQIGNGVSQRVWNGHVSSWGTQGRALSLTELEEITK